VADLAGGPPARLRMRYSKTGKIRFTSHRDVVRMWERALRRSGLPVAWSEGYSPRPLVSFGHALPTGAESLAEYLDVSLTRAAEAGAVAGEPFADLAHRLSALLPAGVEVQAVDLVAEGSGSLQQEVSSCSWELEVSGLAADELASRVERLLAAPSAPLERERKGRTTPDDLRPAVLALAVVPGVGGSFAATASAGPGPAGSTTYPGRSCLEARLATRPRGVRPKELLEVLGPGLRLARACRVHQWIERDGTLVEPLAARGRETGAVAAPAGRRAP